jgi:hypothetical protein
MTSYDTGPLASLTSMYPDDDTKVEELGRSAENLLRGEQRWVVRRKESISFVSDRVVRRTMSIDYELPSDLAATECSAAGTPIFYAPLFFLQKGSDELPEPGPVMVKPEALFAGFDLRNSDGRAMSLPPRSWNARVSVAAMWKAMANASEAHGILLGRHDVIRNVLRRLACSTRNESVRILDELKAGSVPPQLVGLSALLEKDKTLRWLVAACAESSVVMVPLLGKESLQGIVKLAFDQEVNRPPFWRVLLEGAGLRGYDIWFDTPYIGGRTYHVELAAPEGVEIYDAAVVAVAAAGTDTPETNASRGAAQHGAMLQRRSGFATQIHLYVDDALLITGTLWGALALSHSIRTSPTGIPELLLIFPGLIAGYIARPGRHPFTTRLQFLARGAFLLLSATPFVAATALALVARNKSGDLVNESFKPIWLGCAIVASALAFSLLLAWALPQPLRFWQRCMAAPRERYEVLRERFTGG